ncbi:quino protein amine dehydrogenase beta chain-like protein [Ilyonectria destructans]|nr:quino protein amine dehydrogenase beta chain-like protein [Ilyonectria destructans]
MSPTKTLLIGLILCLCQAIVSARTVTKIPSQNQARTVFQFSNGTWVENIAVRRNGDLLVTLIDRPELYQIDPLHSRVKLVENFQQANALSLLGITEMAPDVFIVIAGNFSVSRRMSDPKSYSIWRIDFNRGGKCEKISEIERIPEANFLNGMTTLNHRTDSVLVSDSARGVVWRVDIATTDYEIVLEDEIMKPLQGVPPILGINGIRILGNYLYYVNAPRGLFCRVEIDLSTGKAIGQYEIIATEVPGDDFVISEKGVAYVTENGQNSLERVYLDGKKELVIGGLNSTVIPGATSAAFGRTRKDRNILYVTTAGGQAAPVNGTCVEGGKVVAVTI